MKLYATFALLHEHDACQDRYDYLAKALGGIRAYGKDKPIPLVKILKTNGLDDALWALRAVPEDQVAERDRMARLFACDCAERALDRLKNPDPRSIEAIKLARRFANGKTTVAELSAAKDAAKAAAWDAARAAWDAERKWQMTRLREYLAGVAT